MVGVKEGDVVHFIQNFLGGGSVRSIGGWSQVLSLRRTGELERQDDRILGEGRFDSPIPMGSYFRRRQLGQAEEDFAASRG
jgi:hypothetical protein